MTAALLRMCQGIFYHLMLYDQAWSVHTLISPIWTVYDQFTDLCAVYTFADSKFLFACSLLLHSASPKTPVNISISGFLGNKKALGFPSA